MNWPEFSVALDLFPLLAAVLAAITCGLLGNFLVLRRLSLMGDAISHGVLPGLVIAFLLSSRRDPVVMFAGAAAAGVATVVLVELVKRFGRVEPGAAMGVVFSLMFALGVLLIERADVRHVDLDADCVLHGQLEMLWWPGAPATLAEALSPATLAAVPRQVWTLLVACGLAVAFVTLLFKELRLAAFDASLATALGFSAPLLHLLLTVFVAIATVAAFEAVGSILVIAMLVCPAATARLLTDRLAPQLLVSVVAAIAAAVAGYAGATLVPAAFGGESVNAAGSITVAGGLLLTAAVLAAPRHGVLARTRRRRRLARQVAMDDLLARLSLATAGEPIPGGPGDSPATAALRRVARRRGLLETRNGATVLTPRGEDAAADVLRRRHRWSQYLVTEAGVAPDHVQDSAEWLEHLPITPDPEAEAPGG